MTTNTIEASQRTAARVAGLAHLVSFAFVFFAFYAVQARLIVAGNIAETARRIVAQERLFRVAIVCDLLYVAAGIALLTALYGTLKQAGRGLALFAAFCRLAYVLMWLVIALTHLGVVRLLTGDDYLRMLETDRLHALARLGLGASVDAYYVGLPFWGLASVVCSCLWFRSRYIPRALAGWGVISSAWCMASGLTFLIFPAFGRAVDLYSLDSPLALFEIVLGFWLLFKGLPKSSAEM